MAEIVLENQDNDLSGRYLTFYIGDSTYGIELLHVIEIVKVQPITVIPNVPDYIKGVINLRGKIVPVIDVRLKFGQEELAYQEKTCIIVVEVQEMQMGLIVDSVSDVLTIEPDQLALPPENGSYSSNGNKFLSNLSRVGNRVVLIMDCNKFFHSDLSDNIVY